MEGSGRGTRDSLHVRRLRQERTDGAVVNFERETAFSQVSRRWNSLLCFQLFFTVHDPECRRINVMEQREFSKDLSDITATSLFTDVLFSQMIVERAN